MTRARRSLHVLSCFRPEDLDVTRLSHGAVDFYELLDREIAGNTDLGSPASRAAASEQALGADPLVADLGDRLRARGARVWHQYDGALTMVAAADPLSTIGQDDAEIPRPVAIESDGTEQYRRLTVRERSRLRPQLLERLGWRYMPLWTIEVFTDPSACADRIGGYLGLEKPAVTHRQPASPGFFDDDVENLAVNEAQASDGRTPSGGPDSAEQNRSDQGSKEAGGMNADGDSRNNGEVGNNGDVRNNGEVQNNDEVQNNGEVLNGDPSREGVRDGAPQAADPAEVPAGVLPNKAAEDDPRRWGDEPGGYDHDSWLQEQKPPHWG
jgi:hypothetical protein